MRTRLVTSNPHAMLSRDRASYPITATCLPIKHLPSGVVSACGDAKKPVGNVVKSRNVGIVLLFRPAAGSIGARTKRETKGNMVKVHLSGYQFLSPSIVRRPVSGFPLRVAAVVCLLFSAAFLLAVAPPTRAQTFTPIASFGSQEPSDLILADSKFYATTTFGGLSSKGNVFRITANLSDFTSLHSFSGGNSDGGNPQGAVILSGSTLYGTTTAGGSSFNGGTVFKVDTNGDNYAIIRSFVPASGVNPVGAVALSGSTLYGVTTSGGSNNFGTVFKVNTGGSGYTNLHVFGSAPDARTPVGSLVLAGSTLYGTTTFGGSNSLGTVFKINTDGSGYTLLRSFPAAPEDGFNPYGALILSGSTLYGTTQFGNLSNGTVFRIETNGTGFAVLYDFGLIAGDGYYPKGTLTLSNFTLYGTTSQGGSNDFGTVFEINTDGSGYEILHHFVSSNGLPTGALTLDGSTAYGVSGGVFFSLALPGQPPPPPTPSDFLITDIARQGNDVLITWTSGMGSTNILQVTPGEADGSYSTNNYVDLSSNIILTGTTTNYLDVGGATNTPSRFYRVLLVP
jgi:uncharacterized repeat protein (TIGR03803 family)